MERVTMAGINAALVDKELLRETSNVQQRAQEQSTALVKGEPEYATEAEVSRAVHEVMLAKQLNISLEARMMLVADLMKMGLTRTRLRDMSENVKRQTTYGTIALEYWIQGQTLTPEEVAEERRQMRSMVENERREFAWAVEQEIRRRIRVAKQDKLFDPLTQELIQETAVADEITRLRLRVDELERTTPQTGRSE